jgi:REP element-mobilizing transposase RayT
MRIEMGCPVQAGFAWAGIFVATRKANGSSSQTTATLPIYRYNMPWGLKRYQQARDLHFITFSCYRRQPFLQSAYAKRMFELALEESRRSYRFWVSGYVVMPEHVHLLVSEPERARLAVALQALKQSVARRLIAGRLHFGRPVTMTSMCTRGRSELRSYGICIAIP